MKWINPELRGISVPPWQLTKYQESRLRTFHDSENYLVGFFLLPYDKPYGEPIRMK